MANQNNRQGQDLTVWPIRTTDKVKIWLYGQSEQQTRLGLILWTITTDKVKTDFVANQNWQDHTKFMANQSTEQA